MGIEQGPKPDLPESNSSNESEEDLQEIDLGELDNSIQEYNRQYNWGTMLAEEVTGESSKKISVGELGKMHERALEKTGLSLEPVSTGTLISRDEERPSSEMRMNVSDGGKFITYLKALDEKQLSESQIKGLQTVAQSLTTQLTQQYELDNPNDKRMIELLGHLDQITQQYKRLDEQGKTNLSKPVGNLVTHLDASRKGYLREHVLAEKEQLLSTNQDHTFGPYDWWSDSSSKSFKDNYWKTALEAAKKISDNPKANDLYRQVLSNFKGALRFSKEEIKKRLAQNDWPDRLIPDEEEKLIAIDDLYELVEKMEGKSGK